MALNLGQEIKAINSTEMELYAQQQALYEQMGKSLSDAQASQQSVAIGGRLVSPESVRLDNAKQLQAAAAVNGIAAAAGYSPETSVDIRAILLGDMRDNAMRMREVSDQLAADKSVSLFDDPLQAIINGFTIPWDEQKLQGMAVKQTSLNTSLTDITSGVTNAAASSKAIAAMVTKEQAAEELRLVEDSLAGERKKSERN